MLRVPPCWRAGAGRSSGLSDRASESQPNQTLISITRLGELREGQIRHRLLCSQWGLKICLNQQRSHPRPVSTSVRKSRSPNVIQLQFCRSGPFYKNQSLWRSLESTDAGDWAHQVQKYFFFCSSPGLALWTVGRLAGFGTLVIQVGHVVPLLSKS